MTYADVGGCKEQIQRLREVVELPLLHVSLMILSLSCSRNFRLETALAQNIFFGSAYALLLTPKPERFVNLGIDPPKGVLMYGPPGTGKTVRCQFNPLYILRLLGFFFSLSLYIYILNSKRIVERHLERYSSLVLLSFLLSYRHVQWLTAPMHASSAS